ncbi:MAG: hypothetical protein KatS3mg131_3356 [Candidatus Tectimicrobiota bacterium]|nr:MAG: hypothetical protein KatS3mg131_3356 [Candidatus Tectomicrobia bacterium]
MDPTPAPLAPYRVLDLTDARGLLCGRILADLGADVIQVETAGRQPGAAPRSLLPRRGPPRAQPLLVGLHRQQAQHHPRHHHARRPGAAQAPGDHRRLFHRVGSARGAGCPGAGLCRPGRAQSPAYLRLHHPLWPGRPLCPLPGPGLGGHGAFGLHVRHRRPRPPAGARRLPALLPPRRGRRRHRGDDRPRSPRPERPGAARRRLVPGSGGSRPGQWPRRRQPWSRR